LTAKLVKTQKRKKKTQRNHITIQTSYNPPKHVFNK